jgi:hypothetical protein
MYRQGDVLMAGLQLIAGHLTVELLRSYPSTTSQYFSFAALAVGAFETQFASVISRDSVRK